MESCTDVKRLVSFSDAVFAIAITLLASVLLLFFVRPITNLYARRQLS